jgi:hypothetical protein
VLSACDAAEGAKTACDVVAGTPFACFDKQAVARDNRSCDKAKLTFEISATTAQTLGWKIEGKLNVDAQYALFWKTAQECSLTAKVPVPTDKGGDYIFKAGEAKAIAIMIASGEGKITFLGGTVFSEDVTKKCLGEMAVTAYKKTTAAGCTGPSPSPSPTTTPTGTPSPTPTASATPPMPTPTASATPPMPTPTVSATPPPTPTVSATPPMPTPTVSATPPMPTPTAAPSPAFAR